MIKTITSPEQLENRIAQNYYKIITSGNPYDKNKMLSDIEAAYNRRLMNLSEKKYLEGLVEGQLIGESEEQVKQLW